MRFSARVLTVFCGVLLPTAARAEAPPEHDLLQTIKAVGEKGEGGGAAGKALEELTKSKAYILTWILDAFDGANPLAVNYLRAGFETVAERELRSDREFPSDDLKEFVEDRKKPRRARLLAFEWLQKSDAAAASKLVPGMIDDPSPELRREGVQHFIERAKDFQKNGKNERAAKLYEHALSGAVDDDQVTALVEPLEKLGRKVDLPRHFGFLTEWRIVGPFNNTDGVGFKTVYPPETNVDFDAEYEGQLDEPVKWTKISTDDKYGIVDVAESIENYKGSVMYAVTSFESDKPRPVQLRLGTPNSWKVWVNGKPLFSREEYHRGMKIDQYVVDARFNKGRNVILLKILQNEQEDDWAQRYQFQLRVSDTSGGGLTSADARKIDAADVGAKRE